MIWLVIWLENRGADGILVAWGAVWEYNTQSDWFGG